MTVSPIAAFDDNYIWAIHNGTSNGDAKDVVLVDPGDADPVMAAMRQNGWKLRAILLTHHHYDHIGGVEELTQLFDDGDIPVYGPTYESIKEVTHPLVEGDQIDFDDMGIHLKVLDTPGHTRGHICYYGNNTLFSGDTLFAAGCGRIFEGTAAQMYESLEKIRTLPETTQIYCAHEYTLQNLGFARIVESDNRDIIERLKRVKNLRSQDKPSVPSTLAEELQTNPFLRSQQTVLVQNASLFAQRALIEPAEVFAVVRRWKDSLD